MITVAPSRARLAAMASPIPAVEPGHFRLRLVVRCSCGGTSFASEYGECVEGGDDCFSLGVVYGDADDALTDGVLCGGYAEGECVRICFKNRFLVKLHPFVIFHHRLLPRLRRILANTARRGC